MLGVRSIPITTRVSLPTSKKKISSLKGMGMREDPSQGSEASSQPVIRLSKLFTAKRPTNKGEGPLVRARGTFFLLR